MRFVWVVLLCVVVVLVVVVVSLLPSGSLPPSGSPLPEGHRDGVKGGVVGGGDGVVVYPEATATIDPTWSAADFHEAMCLEGDWENYRTRHCDSVLGVKREGK